MLPHEHEHEHDTEVVDETTVLESRDAVAVTEACQTEGCSYRLQGIDVRGERVTQKAEVDDLAWELYESFYDDPRSIGYITLAHLIDDGGRPVVRQGVLPVLDYLAAAVDLGCADAEDRDAPRDRDAALAAIDYAYPFPDVE